MVLFGMCRCGARLDLRTVLCRHGVMKPPPAESAILAIERPEKELWTYYVMCCFVVPPLFPILVLPAWFRYHTMRYKFTQEGISMSWGILFRRETILNYARIQDIHLRSNVVERWLGLARILVQTASGSASAEMTLEGLKNFEAVRDFLYLKMRGVKDAGSRPQASGATAETALEGPTSGELVVTLREIAQELRAIREAVGRQADHRGGGGDHV